MDETQNTPSAPKAVKVHTCANPDCQKQFDGSGRRGRPFKLCPDCRAKKS